jgi:hypothetical protein
VLGCGIFGIFKHSGNAAVEIYEGLLMLQHRGQDSAGIVSFDGERFRERKARVAPGRWHAASARRLFGWAPLFSAPHALFSEAEACTPVALGHTGQRLGEGRV